MDSKFLHKITEASKVNAELQHKIEQLQAKHNKCVLEHTRLISENLKLQAERDRLREALKFYADISEWSKNSLGSPWALLFNSTHKDGHGYEVAQKALGGSDE